MRAARTVYDDRHRPFEAVGRDIVEFALRAPSVHNTQPWAWRIGDGRLDLYAARERQLPVSDPSGRNLTISCGAALEYAVVGAAADGWQADVELLPEPGAVDHLATIRFTSGSRSRRALADASLLAARTTDRRRLIPWPVPAQLLDGLAARSGHGTASVLALTNLADQLSVELLVGRAMAIERADAQLVDEQDRWIADHRPDRIPAENAYPRDAGLQALSPSRFDPAQDQESQDVTPHRDGMLVILSDDDAPRDWIDTGRALCRTWVAAMDHGLALVPLSQVIEVDDVRAALRLDVLDVDSYPQLLLRLGWQELSRSPLRPTPRLPVDDVLLS